MVSAILLEIHRTGIGLVFQIGAVIVQTDRWGRLDMSNGNRLNRGQENSNTEEP